MKYRHKPIEVEAIQFTGDNKEEVIAFSKGDVLCGSILGCAPGLIISKGYWIVKEVTGRLYLCTPEMFEEIYECVDNR